LIAWLDTCWDWLTQFNAIYLYGDNDDAGRGMINKLHAKLSDHALYYVAHDFKDANELLFRCGPAAVKAAYDAAVEIPVVGLIDLASVTPLDIRNMPAVTSSIKELNRKLGGFMMGDVSIWTGKRGDGKSTVLSLQMLDALEQGFNVCAYSGELRADRFQYWADIQAAGKKYIMSYYDAAKDKVVYYVPKEIQAKIHTWYARRYWLYDNKIVTENEEMTILNRFEMAARRFDCKVFMVDNLMSANFSWKSDNDFYRQQSNFVGQLVAFASKYNVHVHLVAHPRKSKDKTFDTDDVSGSGDITNRAANVILVKREEKVAWDTTIEVKKNRWEGSGGKFGLKYCGVSRRLYEPAVGDTVRYSWEDVCNDDEAEPIYPELPF
jgi:twinkle protein